MASIWPIDYIIHSLNDRCPCSFSFPCACIRSSPGFNHDALNQARSPTHHIHNSRDSCTNCCACRPNNGLSCGSQTGGPCKHKLCQSLTHLPLDKMAANLADDVFECVFLYKMTKIPIQISVKFVPRSPIDNKPALVQVMAWRLINDKPLSEPMMTQFNEAYMRPYHIRWVKMYSKHMFSCGWYNKKCNKEITRLNSTE